MDEELTPEEAGKFKQAMALNKAIREAMFEIVGEQKNEIIKRARAKLVAMGLIISDEEVGKSL